MYSMTIYKECACFGSEIEFRISFNYIHEKGCMYMKNGDPGYPDFTEFSINKIEMILHGVKHDVTDHLIQKFEEDDDLQIKAAEVVESYHQDRYLED